MSVRLSKLESLLSRVQTRSAEPRVVRTAVTPVDELDSVETDDLALSERTGIDLDEPELDAPGDGVPLAAAPELDELDDVEMDELDDVEFDDEVTTELGHASGDMEAAMAAAASAPPLTPPPESGEDISSPRIPEDQGPTMEQLGETIHLEEATASRLELDEPVSAYEIPPSKAAESSEELLVPENAREDLQRVRLGEETSVEARVSKRPVLSTNAVEFVSSAKEFEPESFFALLEASLSLK